MQILSYPGRGCLVTLILPSSNNEGTCEYISKTHRLSQSMRGTFICRHIVYYYTTKHATCYKIPSVAVRRSQVIWNHRFRTNFFVATMRLYKTLRRSVRVSVGNHFAFSSVSITRILLIKNQVNKNVKA